MEKNTHYIETTFMKYEHPKYLWSVEEFFDDTIKISPMFLLPSCSYAVTMMYQNDDLILQFDFKKNHYGGYLFVICNILHLEQARQIIDKTHKIIKYEDLMLDEEEFDVSLEVTHIFPVTKQLPNFKLKQLPTIMRHITSLQSNSELSDLSIYVEDSVFPVHKCILAAHSPIFRNMFTIGMKEQKDKKIYITNIAKETCNSMLSYIYTNKFNDLDNIANNLIFIADMYNIQDLVELCKETLIKSMNVENVFDTLIIADNLHIKDLELHCLQYISKNRKNINSKKKYEDIKKYSNIVIKLVDFMMN
ncbi:protein maternal effect lethal 26-like [Vespa velutina]|uniref:protein maternal effect lethal 26-like n=1 Tax=Vespa velutina TaxID=202808 RepID=UPI001FB38354|nr:protein maternal effect lethal 26-like [Vespa velutina]